MTVSYFPPWQEWPEKPSTMVGDASIVWDIGGREVYMSTGGFLYAIRAERRLRPPQPSFQACTRDICVLISYVNILSEDSHNIARAVMPRLPVSPPQKLFALLRHLHIDQNSLAAHLGVSHTLVSFWAHGKVPIPEKHRARIDALIHETFAAIAAEWEHKAHINELAYRHLASEAGEEETEAMRAAMATWKNTLAAWKAALNTYCSMGEEVFSERLLLSGDLHRVLYQACRTVGHYGTLQPQHLSADEREEMRHACVIVQESLRRLGRLESTSLDTQLAHQREVIDQQLREVG
jgi:DNA-binding transcriptional regulator YdaS (Cro superfamily)